MSVTSKVTVPVGRLAIGTILGLRSSMRSSTTRPAWIDKYYCNAVAWVSMEFEWDPEKERGNIAKHGLDFRAAARVFLDPFLLEVEDDRGYESHDGTSSAWSTGGCSS